MNIIASVSNDWGIGNCGNLLNRFKEDMRFFKEKTIGNIVIMGRTTLESFPNGKPLPNRENVVLSRDPEFSADGVLTFNDINSAVEYAKSKYKSEDIYFIGGAEVYNQALEMRDTDTAYITKFNEDYTADRFIPNLDESNDWTAAEKTDVEVEKNGEIKRLTFVKYMKK